MFGEESDASITRIQRKEENMKTLKRFFKDKNAFGVVEIVLIIIGICIADKSRILCGNFRCI